MTEPMTEPMPAERILIVEDDAALLDTLDGLLEGHGWETGTASDGSTALARLQAGEFDLVVTDLVMPGMGGEALLDQIRAAFPETPVLAISGFVSAEEAAALTRAGAVDVLSKPLQTERLLESVRRALDTSRSRRLLVRAGRAAGGHLRGFIGRSAPMKRLFEQIGRLASSPAPVLITGETGTGKELVAGALHQASGRDAFVAVNCAAIPEKLLESELFGHVKGAFTGAHEDRKGLFEQADGGTLFLDEIGDLPLSLQAKLLRTIQFGELRRVGESEAREVRVRVLAATHRDLGVSVREGRFREDLFYRINVLRLDVPPLRDRPSDIPLLTEHFVAELARRDGREARFSSAALGALLAYRWPGNVRELQHAVEFAVVLEEGPEVGVEDLPPPVAAAAAAAFAAEPPRIRTLAEVEREHILGVLEAADGNRSRAAELLAIPRRTLYRRLEEYGIRGEGE
jgi:DNA-binding NtrC family response regulator